MDDTTEAKAKNRGGRPRNDPTKTPEFKVAVDAAVNAAVAAALPAIVAAIAGKSGPDATVEGNEGFAKHLANAIADIAQEGNPRKRLSPEEKANREAHKIKLDQLVAQAQRDGEVCEYRVIKETYLNETLVRPFRADPATKKIEPVDIEWSGIPNDCMRPLNKTATAIFVEFMGYIGGNIASKTADSRDLSVTQGGLVIKGVTSSRRSVGNLADSNNGNPFADSLSLRANHDPRERKVAVLGTVAAPAVQSGAGA